MFFTDQSNTPHLIYTPVQGIPIGEPVILPDGTHAIRLRYRRGKRACYEVVTLDKLHELIVRNGQKMAGNRGTDAL